ncbi:hypothetical protein NC651_001840 [Populus alba x Populus x berolinensis]|nr:hypothetical protein NC651_001840 [Populus alba x Populus x berolinensis]
MKSEPCKKDKETSWILYCLKGRKAADSLSAWMNG